jgi:hypothetical protein
MSTLLYLKYFQTYALQLHLMFNGAQDRGRESLYFKIDEVLHTLVFKYD